MVIAFTDCLRHHTNMTFSHLVSYFEQIEATTKRLQMFSILADLFHAAQTDEIDQIIYFLKGELLPPFHGVQTGMAEKYLLRAIAKAASLPAGEDTLLEQHRLHGDIGKTAEQYIPERLGEEQTVSGVYQSIYQIAMMSGEGSVDQKIESLAQTFFSLSGMEAKYVARFVAGKLRLGVGDATMIEALALSHGDRAFRGALDRAYNLTSDLGLLAKMARTSGVAGVSTISVRLGYPIRPALCERAASPDEIIKRLGTCAIEIKYDGFRCQAHKKGNDVTLFSRNQERTTSMFPEIVEALKTVFEGQEIILEGEALAFNEATGESFPFQVTLQRKRKHGVLEMSQSIPLKFFIFDLFFLNGVDYTSFPYSERRKRLMALLPANPVIEMAEAIEVSDPEEVTRFFNDAIERGFEGIVAKRLESAYTAGARNFNWIKLKRSYRGELTDTLDLCIVGYFLGKGARAAFGIGTILAAAYDQATGRFKTVSKIGTGFSEIELQNLKVLLDETLCEKPPDLDSKIVPDRWVLPKYVIQVTADEITRSRYHTAGEDESGTGYALRFPRVVSFLRLDKGPYDTTSVDEIISLFNQQRHIQIASS